MMVFESMQTIFHPQIPQFGIGIERTTCDYVVTRTISIKRTYLYRVSLQAEANYISKQLLLSVFRSHTFMEPRFEPTTT